MPICLRNAFRENQYCAFPLANDTRRTLRGRKAVWKTKTYIHPRKGEHDARNMSSQTAQESTGKGETIGIYATQTFLPVRPLAPCASDSGRGTAQGPVGSSDWRALFTPKSTFGDHVSRAARPMTILTRRQKASMVMGTPGIYPVRQKTSACEKQESGIDDGLVAKGRAVSASDIETMTVHAQTRLGHTVQQMRIMAHAHRLLLLSISCDLTNEPGKEAERHVVWSARMLESALARIRLWGSLNEGGQVLASTRDITDPPPCDVCCRHNVNRLHDGILGLLCRTEPAELDDVLEGTVTIERLYDCICNYVDLAKATSCHV